MQCIERGSLSISFASQVDYADASPIKMAAVKWAGMVDKTRSKDSSFVK
jgi:hypothetical protein